MDSKWMELALSEAQKAFSKDEVPIGAVIIQDDKLIASTHNQTITQNDACAHAEVLCIQQACKALDNHRLTNCQLYITLEPCIMCYGAIIQSRIPQIYFGAYDKRTGIFSNNKLSKQFNLNHHPVAQGGILEAPCQNLLTEFFSMKR